MFPQILCWDVQKIHDLSTNLAPPLSSRSGLFQFPLPGNVTYSKLKSLYFRTVMYPQYNRDITVNNTAIVYLCFTSQCELNKQSETLKNASLQQGERGQ